MGCASLVIDGVRGWGLVTAMVMAMTMMMMVMMMIMVMMIVGIVGVDVMEEHRVRD